MFWVKSSGDLPPCPFCGGELRYRDSRKRIRKKEGGQKDYLMIRRLKCTSCHCHHMELPDCLVPHKHYQAEVISGVLDGIVTPEDEDAEDYPSFQTMLRWIRWFIGNLQNIEGHLRNAARQICRVTKSPASSLLETIRKTYANWLEIILRIIYNSGGFLPSLALI